MKLGRAFLSSACCLVFTVAPTSAEQVGVSAAVNPSAYGTPPGESMRTIRLGDRIVHNEHVETDTDGLLQILLADGTTFTVGPDSSLTIDSFVYDPDTGTAELTASASKGIFRFIGGIASKRKGGVNIKTPVGTVGIRGAIADMRVTPVSFEGQLLFGRQLSLTTDQATGTQKNYEVLEGQGIIAGISDGSLDVRTGIISPEMVYEIGRLLWANNADPDFPPLASPDYVNEMLEQYQSEQRKQQQQAILARQAQQRADEKMLEQLVKARKAQVNLTQEAWLEKVRRELDNESGDNDGGGTSGGNEDGETPGDDDGGTPDDGGGETPEYSDVPLRVLTAGEEGPDGVVGGSPTRDQSVTLKVEKGKSEGSGELAQGIVTLPVYDVSTFTAREVDEIASPFGPLSGTAFAGPDGFTSYLLGVKGDPPDPFYAITGTETDGLSVFQGDGVRRYSLTADPLQGVSVPFVTDNPNFDFSGAAASDLFVAESANVAEGSARVFQNWITINGTGTDQKSAIGVNVGAVESDGKGFDLDRRGSYRVSANGPSFQMFGTAGTIAGTSGGAIFGSNGENFVVSDDLQEPGHFYDSQSNKFIAGADFSTIHVGNLETEEAVPTRQLSGEYNGYAAGVIEGVYPGPDGTFNPVLAKTSGPDVKVIFNPENRSLGGSIRVEGNGPMGTPDELIVSFGDGIDGNTEDGASAHIDDDTFGATANPNNDETYVIQNELVAKQVNTQEAATYLVSSGAVEGLSESEFMSGVDANHRCTECDFLKWGWWGTQAEVAVSEGDASEVVQRVGVHLGSWAVGDIADVSELSTSTATYQGLAVGNVVNNDASYVAAGEMDMDYNFGLGTGEVSVSGFDGRDFGGTVNGATSGQATFEGALAGDGGVEGWANGAFVNDGSDIAAGVIGDFQVDDGANWRASGIFAGQRR